MGVLESAGVSHGVHDFRQGQRTREEYHALQTSHMGDTRNRVLGVDVGHSTFNARTRSLSYGASGFHPKGTYTAPLRAPHPDAEVEYGNPPKVVGGMIHHFQPNSLNNERSR